MVCTVFLLMLHKDVMFEDEMVSYWPKLLEYNARFEILGLNAHTSRCSDTLVPHPYVIYTPMAICHMCSIYDF